MSLSRQSCTQSDDTEVRRLDFTRGVVDAICIEDSTSSSASIQVVGWWPWTLAIIDIVSHVLKVVFIVYLAILHLFQLDDIGYKPWVADVVRTKGTFCLLIAPWVIYETLRHWSRGTYFPMTASDSVYLLRFGRCVDTRPPKIRLSTIRNMLVLCHFTSLMCLLNFVIVDRTWKLNCTSGYGRGCANRIEWWYLRINWYLLLFFILRQARQFVYDMFFTMIYLATLVFLLWFCIITLGLGCIPVYRHCVRGFDRDSTFCCVPVRFFFDMAAWFYQRI